MVNPIRWAVLGPGNIARRFATQLPSSQYGTLVAVGSSDPERARTFAEEFGAGESGDYASVLNNPEVDAVYVATVHTSHAELTIAALRAGKHVLCEKPIAPNHGQAMAMVDAARTADRVLVEAYMYRFHPQTRKVLELVGDGTIGELVHIDAAFSFATGRSEGRLFDPNLAGGGILDVGGYPVSYARAIAGAAAGQPFLDPDTLTAKGTLDLGVDVWSVAQLTFPGGVTASARTGVRVSESSVTVYGSKGMITITDPWTLSEQPKITITVAGQEPQELIFEAKPYALEADGLAAAVGSGETAEMSLADTLGNAKALDAWRQAIGLRYPFEADDANIPTVSGLPLRVDDSTMRYGEIAGIGKRISRLVMGCDNQPNLSHASALFDNFYELGGNAFDTAYIYGGGNHEKLLGQWIRNRGIREDVVVITKGAHTPHCDPESITRQLLESLERQGTDYTDLYLMHRDNEDIGVGEFVDVLDEHVKAGRIKVFGGSNWSPERIDEANAYARQAGKQGFEVLSNHFGLAEAYDVPWKGCRHATDPESKRWLTERQIPLFPWSSQARGFFTGRARPDDRSDAELVRCYYSDENFERLRRAEKIGAEFGVAATAIALAFVLHQPFPTFPLFGPRSIAETRSSVDALKVQLTPEQVAYLDLATD
ncbi:aldo/keto reductase [Microlunatus parietis]|uniref:Putative dehydrogenase/aryl-alcohol dehydrogenase-like putative oxidoreductase n=1 Tax=Microlunatus parietis TaxID=682979 RepID=A0A7Y9I6U0_9ACTN|nr:aldo/keto reductase [Microlunatus parietis]NYE71347.1 putative dehydrogenase/aryl-alcohol dehydrogenase-like putative oxidoreductase [Microlunatus parietis]